MVSVIITVFSLVVFAVSMGLCIWLGCRRGWFNSAVRLGLFVPAGALSLLLARLIAPAISKALLPLLLDSLGEVPLLSSATSITNLLARFAAGVLAPLLFIVLFFVLDKLTWIAYVPLKKKFADREELHTTPHDRVYGAVLGGVLALGITIACVMAPCGYIGYVCDTAKKIETLSMAEDVLPKETKELLDDTAAAPVLKADRVLSGWLFNALAADLNNTTESALAALRVVDSLANVDSQTASTSPSQVLEEVLASPKNVAFLAEVLSDVITDLVPDNNPLLTQFVGCLKDSLNTLAKAGKTMSEAEYQQEVQALSDLLSLAQNPGNVTPDDAVKVILQSQSLTTAIADQSDALLQEIGKETIALSPADQKKMKTVIKEYENSKNANKEMVKLLRTMFGIS